MSVPVDPTIVVTRRWPSTVEEKLRATYRHVQLSEGDEPLGEKELRAALASADVLLPCVADRLSARMLLEPGVRTRFIGNFGVGFSNIDVDAARSAGIVVTNTPGVLTDTTADLTMTLLLMTARRAGEGERHVRGEAWTGWRPTHMMGGEVTGRTLGIVGMGRIGRAVARRRVRRLRRCRWCGTAGTGAKRRRRHVRALVAQLLSTRCSPRPTSCRCTFPEARRTDMSSEPSSWP